MAWEAPVDAVAGVAVDMSASAPAGQALFSCGASPRGFRVIRDFLIGQLPDPRAPAAKAGSSSRGPSWALRLALRPLGDLAVGGGGVEAFRTSSTTSCH